MTLDKTKFEKMLVCKVKIFLKNQSYPQEGWIIGKNALTIASKFRNQTIMLLASDYRVLKEAGWNMSEVMKIVVYNSDEIVYYTVEEFEVISCITK